MTLLGTQCCEELLSRRVPKGTKEVFSPSYQSNVGSGATTDIIFKIPFDYKKLIDVKLQIQPLATNAAWDLDLNTRYCNVEAGESVTKHTGADTTSTYATTNAYGKEIDLSGVLASMNAGDTVHLIITNNETDGLYTFGVRLLYESQTLD